MGNVGERPQLFNVDFAGLENLFGGSIFVEEYRGNFVEAGKRITQYANSLQNPSLDQQATVLLLQAVHSNLVGDNRAAAAALDTLLRIEQPFSREWRLRATVYGLFCLSTTTFPPYFRFCPESLYLSSPNEASKLALNIVKLCDTLNDPSNDMNRLEYDVIICLFLSPRQLKQTAFTVNSSSPLTALGTSFETLAAGLCTACQMLASLRDSAHAKHLQSLGRYLDRWIYEICQAQGLSLCYTCPSVSRDPRAQLQNLQKSYQNARDIVGEAVCKLLEGDSAISPPFTNITVLNLMIVEGMGSSAEHVLWDQVEAKIKPGNLEIAGSSYEDALVLFADAGAQRGEAAVYLRKGCMKHMVAISTEACTPLSLKEALEFFDMALQKFQAAGDRRAIQLTKTHQLLAHISLGGTGNLKKEAVSIGKWATETENVPFAHALGLLILRFGNRVWRQYARFSMARVCHQSASALFTALDTPFTAFQATMALGSLYSETGDYSQASLVFREAHELLSKIVATEESLANAITPGSRKDIAVQCLHDLLNKTLNCYFEMGDRRMQHQTLENTELNLEKLVAGNQDFVTRWKTFLTWQDDLTRYTETTSKEDYDEVRFLLGKNRPLHRTGDENQDKLAKVALLVRLERFEEAQRILEELDNAEWLGTHFSGYANSINNPTFTRSAKLQNVQYAFNMCVSAKDYRRALRFFERIQSISPNFFSFDSDDKKARHWASTLNAGLMYEGLGKRQEALQCFVTSCHLAESHREVLHDSHSRLYSFGKADVGKAFISAVRISLLFHAEGYEKTPQEFQCTPRLTQQTWTEQGLHFLEQAKARHLLDTLAGYSGDSQALLANWAENSYNVRLCIELLALRGERLEEEAELKILKERLAESREKLESESPHAITALSMLSSDCSLTSLFLSIAEDSAVLELGLSDQGLALIFVTRHGIEYAGWLPLTMRTAERAVSRFLSEMRKASEFHQEKQEQGKPEFPKLSPRIKESVAVLSHAIIGPVEHLIRSKKHIVFIPSQSLAHFPFATLSLDDRPLFLTVTVSVVPSLQALQHLQQQNLRKSPPSSPSISIIANPDDPSFPPLPYAGIEAVYIARKLQAWPKLASRITDLKSVVERCGILHLDTHGHFDENSPWLSFVALKTPFRVLDFMRLNLSRAALVVLSTCLSGLGRVTFSDDAFSFAHMILGCGAQSFIGSLWATDDIATLFLMAIFYDEMATVGEDVCIAEIWRRAQKRLYDLDQEGLTKLVQEIIKAWEDAREAGQYPNAFVFEGDEIMKDRLKDIQQGKLVWDFRHPYLWAPYYIAGNGELVCRGLKGGELLDDTAGDDSI